MADMRRPRRSAMPPIAGCKQSARLVPAAIGGIGPAGVALLVASAQGAWVNGSWSERMIAAAGFGGQSGLGGRSGFGAAGVCGDGGGGAGVQFPVAGVQLEFHVVVTKSGEGRAGVKFWVVELGGAGSYTREEIQTVTVTLGAPVDQSGDPVKIYRGSAQ